MNAPGMASIAAVVTCAACALHARSPEPTPLPRLEVEPPEPEPPLERSDAASAEVVVDGVRLVVTRPDPPVIRQGELVAFHVELTTGVLPVEVGVGGASSEVFDFDVVQVNRGADDAVAGETRRGKRLRFHAEKDGPRPIRLGPGATVARTIPLSTLFDMSIGGEYAVTPVVRVRSDAGHPWKVLRPHPLVVDVRYRPSPVLPASPVRETRQQP